MSPAVFDVKQNECYDPLSFCVLVVDTTSTMQYNDIDELDYILRKLIKNLKEDNVYSQFIEVSIISFGETVEILQNSTPLENISIPRFNSKGNCNVETAVYHAMKLIDERKKKCRTECRQYYRPWIFLITNGESSDKWESSILSKRIKQDEKERQYLFLPIGLEHSNIDALNRIAGNYPPLKLDGFYGLLSECMSRSRWIDDEYIPYIP